MMCKSLLTVAIVLLSPCGWTGQLPPVTYSEWTTEKNVFVPMRDGIHLDTDIWLPKDATGRLPAVLVSTPYDKNGQGWVEFFVKHGYAVVVQSQRGRYFSEGEFKSYLHGATTDGYDTIEWITRQPWSNGKVGAAGCSASADVQWPIAESNPPGLAARLTVAGGEGIGSMPGDETRGAFYRGGVPALGFWASWYREAATTERLLLPLHSTQEQRIRLRNTFSLKPTSDPATPLSLDHLPSQYILRIENRAITPFDQLITWTPVDPRWNEVTLTGAGAKPRSPALLIETWHDDAVMETARLFKALQDQGVEDHYLIIGPGPHCASFADFSSTSSLAHFKFGDLDIGDARYRGVDRGYASLYLNWLDHWLKGENNHVIDMPKVQLFIMGKGWIAGDQWPLKEIRGKNYYLDADSASLNRPGTGLLIATPPRHRGKATYLYDPASPTPSLGSALDQRPVEARADVLTFSTPTLEKPITLAGPIEVVLYVSSTAKDTDFMVRLSDVYPDGKAVHLSDDAFRARYREGFDRKVFMQAGGVYKIILANMITGIEFARGHRIRLDISSSSFPRYERNLNSGGNNYDETAGVVAENTVHYGSRYPSHLVLPILPP